MADKKRLIYAEDALVGLQYISMYGDVNDTMIQAAMRLARSKIQNAPTVDAVEVVHGRWVAVPSSDMMTGKAYKCSECNKMRYGSFMPNYCQHCGTKMDLEV